MTSEVLSPHIQDTEHGTVESVPFPTASLPSIIRTFVIEATDSLSVPPDYVALAALVAASAAIGNSLRIQIKTDWEESAALYAAIIGVSGQGKSPALDCAIRNIQSATLTPRRWASDTTIEKLSVLLSEQKRGICIVRDELSGLFHSLNQYKSGKGTDAEFYLSAWSQRPYAVDRQKVSYALESPYISIIGGTTPPVLKSLASRKLVVDGDGFLERFLYAVPDFVTQEEFNDRSISSQAKQDYADLLVRLFDLDARTCGNGRISLALSPDAKSKWVDWRRSYLQALPEHECFVRRACQKLIAYSARLALIHALCERPSTLLVDTPSIDCACTQVDYFTTQVEKVAGILCPTDSFPTKRASATTRDRIMRHLAMSACRRLNSRKLQLKFHGEAQPFRQAIEELIRDGEIYIDNDARNGKQYVMSTVPVPTTDMPTQRRNDEIP
jgi:hypothetical protein